jgi:hypothetical protein
VSLTLGRLLGGHRETIAGTVYGTIVVLSLLTGGAAAYKDDLWRLIAITGASTVVLWAAHVYSHGLGESVRAERRLSGLEITTIARRESSILLAAVLPECAVALGAVGLIRGAAALWIALGLGIATLTIQALRYAYLERLSRLGAMLAVALNLVFGAVFVVVKVVLAH